MGEYGGRRVDRQRDRVADVGHVQRVFQMIDHRKSAFLCSDPERQDPARHTVSELPLRDFMIRAAGKGRIIDLAEIRQGGKILRQRTRRIADPFHAQTQRLQSLQVQKSVRRCKAGSHVPPQGGRKHPEQKFIQVDTKNILFICGGAFDGIERKIASRLNTQVVGFDSVEQRSKVDLNNLMKYVSPQDLKSFGLIPEIIGRLPVVTSLQPLDREALRNILTEPKNSIVRQYVKIFKLDGVDLTFKPEVLDFVVDKALEFKLGARGLRSIVETIMIDAMYEIPSSGRKSYTVTLDYARRQLDKADGAVFEKV